MYLKGQVLVSYSYYEKDKGQRDNFDFFIMAGMGIGEKGAVLPQATDFNIVISGDRCGPCHSFKSLVRQQKVAIDGLAAAWSSQRLSILHRSVNIGMDFSAHNVRTKPLNKDPCWHCTFQANHIAQWICSQDTAWQSDYQSHRQYHIGHQQSVPHLGD